MVDLEGLQSLATWMRGVGAVRARVGDLDLELGPVPEPAPPPETPLTAGEAEAAVFAMRRAAVLDDLNVRYAHVGGWQGSEEELERLVRAS